MDCTTHANALLSKWVSNSLIEPTIEWALIFLELLAYFTWEQRRALNRASYTSLDRILLGRVRTCRSMPYTMGVWKSWVALRRHLFLAPTNNDVLSHWRVEDILHALHPFVLVEENTLKNITLTLGKIGITKAGNLWEPTNNSWKSFEEKLLRTRGIPSEMRVLTSQFLQLMYKATRVIDERTTDPDLWTWANDVPTNGSFALTNRQTYLLLLEDHDEWVTLNSQWSRQDSKLIWGKRWKMLWGFDLTHRAKLFIWQILMNSMYNMERVQKVGHGDGCCTVCPSTQETNEHIFFGCYKARRGWVATILYYEAAPQESSVAAANPIIDILDGCLKKMPHDIAMLSVLYHTYWALWNHRNERLYQGCSPQFSPRVTTEQEIEHIMATTK